MITFCNEYPMLANPLIIIILLPYTHIIAILSSYGCHIHKFLNNITDVLERWGSWGWWRRADWSFPIEGRELVSLEQPS